MLKPLQPGIEPLGQFDIEDDDRAVVRGGEVGVIQALDVANDYYAADVGDATSPIHVALGDVAAHGNFYGLVDEGTSQGGDGVASYGTLFGTVIGVTTGKGTGFGTQSTTNIQVVGPDTMTGSGKVTLWTKPGLYGVTVQGWESAGIYNAMGINGAVYGCDGAGGPADSLLRGKLTSTADGVAVGLFIQHVTDYSLVSTTNVAAGETAERQYGAVYLSGVQVA